MDNLDLDNLLSEALQSEKAKQDIASARKKAVTARPGSQEFLEANAFVKQWERENDWRGIAVELLVCVDTCESCGKVHHNVQGLFHVHQHVRFADRLDKRRIGGKAVPEGLPRRTFYHHGRTPFCGECYTSHGFPRE